MALSSRTDLTAHQGSELYLQFRLFYRDSEGTETPYNLVNKSTTGQVRTTYDSATAYDFEVNIADASTGAIVVYMGADVTSTLPTGPLVYDIEVSDNLNPAIAQKPLWGSFYLRPEVTR